MYEAFRVVWMDHLGVGDFKFSGEGYSVVTGRRQPNAVRIPQGLYEVKDDVLLEYVRILEGFRA
jgi:hypothetical protein